MKIDDITKSKFQPLYDNFVLSYLSIVKEASAIFDTQPHYGENISSNSDKLINSQNKLRELYKIIDQMILIWPSGKKQINSLKQVLDSTLEFLNIQLDINNTLASDISSEKMDSITSPKSRKARYILMEASKNLNSTMKYLLINYDIFPQGLS
jgi:hypothetical protein